MTHILDDHIFIEQTYDQCSNDLRLFLKMADSLNIPIKQSKTLPPSTTAIVHGFEVDTICMEARLPLDKLQKINAQLHGLKNAKKTTLKTLQALIGLLNFACRVVIPGRTFLRRLIDLTKGIKKPHHRIRLNSEARADINAWLAFTTSYNGKTLFFERNWLSSDKIKLYYDSAGSLGYAGIFGSAWFNGKWPVHWRKLNICFLELFPLVTSIHIWGPTLANKCVLFMSDNKAVVDVINIQTAKDQGVMMLLRQLVTLAMKHNIIFQARHIPGRQNVIADHLSRLQITQAKQLAPWLDQNPLTLPPHLLPENFQLPRSYQQHLRKIH